MGLTGRLKRWLGLSYRSFHPYACTVYRYDVTHIDGSVTTVYGHTHDHDGAFLIVKEVAEEGWFCSNVAGFDLYPPYECDVVARLESIKSYEKTPVTRDVWMCLYDHAESEIDKVMKSKRNLEKCRNT